MKHLLIFLFPALLILNLLPAQSKKSHSNLPVTLIPAKKEGSEMLVLFISGDGGWNNFSQKLADQYAAAGIPVIGLNSFKYFWNKKTPEQAANDIAGLLYEYCDKWKKKSILLCGYSFGAEVMPFIFLRLPADLKEKINRIQLLSPASFTDFEIHVSDLFGSKNSMRKMNVASEVEKINKPVICYYGILEKEKPLQHIETSNYKTIILKGDHHYENSFEAIVETALK